jgi:hypothetical protein
MRVVIVERRKRITPNKTMNCVMYMVVLLLAGRIDRIIYIRKRKHFCGVTHKGNIIHFKTTTKRDDWAPYLFLGYLEVIGKYRPGKHLEFYSVLSLARFLVNGRDSHTSNNRLEGVI